MGIDFEAYRTSQKEQSRINDLFRLIPNHGLRVLDVGARDGFLSLKLAERFDHVVALDLEKPNIDHPKVECVKGNAGCLQFPDESFDTAICAEVLEHIPPEQLRRVCDEIVRVSRGQVIIGVPYRQDLRFGQTTCSHCGKSNPPWGHVNSFDEETLLNNFPGLKVREMSFVGITRDRTNALSASLMRYAGNPYGTYTQDEPCVHCESSLGSPAQRNFQQKVATRIAIWVNNLQRLITSPQPNWIHVALEK